MDESALAAKVERTSVWGDGGESQETAFGYGSVAEITQSAPLRGRVSKQSTEATTTNMRLRSTVDNGRRRRKASMIPDVELESFHESNGGKLTGALPVRPLKPKDAHVRLLVRTAVVSRILLWMAIVISQIFITKYDSSTLQLFPRNPSTEPAYSTQSAAYSWPMASNSYTLDSFLRPALEPFLRWDAFYFLHIAEHGYVFEHQLAFFPLLPSLMKLLATGMFTFAFYVFEHIESIDNINAYSAPPSPSPSCSTISSDDKSHFTEAAAPYIGPRHLAHIFCPCVVIFVPPLSRSSQIPSAGPDFEPVLYPNPGGSLHVVYLYRELVCIIDVLGARVLHCGKRGESAKWWPQCRIWAHDHG